LFNILKVKYDGFVKSPDESFVAQYIVCKHAYRPRYVVIYMRVFRLFT